MIRNSVLQKIKEIENFSNEQILEIFHLAGKRIPANRVERYLASPESEKYLVCGAEALGHFLDGLILYKRGPSNKKDENNKPISLTNNLILKKLRVAYNLKESDLYAIFQAVDIDITKSELSALFRKEEHRKFRYCPDVILELFLEGLQTYLINR